MTDAAVAGATATIAASATSSGTSLLEGPGAIAAGQFGGTDSRGGGLLSNPLGLTDNQLSQAEDIFTGARTDIEALRSAAHDEIAALLTEDQAVTFDELHPGPRQHIAGNSSDNSSSSGQADFALAGGDFGIGGCGLIGGDGAPDAATILSFLSDALNLTADQQTAIQPILENLITAVSARRDQAQTDFRAILTADQIATLDSLQSQYASS